MPRPIVAQTKYQNPVFATPQWITVSYYMVSSYMVLSGLLNILVGSGLFRSHSIFGVVMGAVSVFIGVGLLLRIELIRGIVNLLCGLKILFGILGLLASLALTSLLGIFGFVLVVMNMFDIATAGFMIYLIGETADGPGF